MNPARSLTWWDRNWKWFVPAGCLSALVLAAGLAAAIAYFAFSLMKSSEAYRQAFARAQASPAVAASLGAPLKDGLIVSGNIRVNGPSGTAELSIPISGPKGRGTLYLKATKAMGRWTLDELVAEIDGTGQRLDLLEAPAP